MGFSDVVFLFYMTTVFIGFYIFLVYKTTLFVRFYTGPIMTEEGVFKVSLFEDKEKSVPELKLLTLFTGS